MNMNYYQISAEELGKNAKVPLLKLGDSGEVFYEIALEMVNEIEKNNAVGRRTVFICPVGPVDHSVTHFRALKFDTASCGKGAGLPCRFAQIGKGKGDKTTMIIVLKQDAPDVQVREFCHELEGMGLQINDSKGSDTHILGLIGDTKAIAESWVLANPVVETCRRVSEPYKKANRKFHPDDSVIDVDGVKIGGGNFAVIAGPCSIESEEQITYCAQRVKAAGASLLRGGAFKPRTSPYSFQGMRSEGLDLLKLARRATGAPIVTEIMNTEHLPLFENVDLIQVGARNMQNFELLKAVGRQNKPVLLKRGLANTLEEFVMSAEYIMAEGNENVILCERGIRTFETSMRNTLDLAGVVMLHKMTHLPVVVDPSHACGHAWMVPELAKAAVAAGADGLMIEVHNNPAKAKCDGAQSLTPDQFDELMQFIGKEVEFFGKKMN